MQRRHVILYMSVNANADFFCVFLLTWLNVLRANAAVVCKDATRLIYGCLATGSTISHCVPTCPRIHTYTHQRYRTERALQLVTGCSSQSAASLFNTQLSIQLLSLLISSPASKLRYVLFKKQANCRVWGLRTQDILLLGWWVQSVDAIAFSYSNVVL